VERGGVVPPRDVIPLEEEDVIRTIVKTINTHLKIKAALFMPLPHCKNTCN
jgi:hypothetical protein